MLCLVDVVGMVGMAEFILKEGYQLILLIHIT
jgi:hypothetical protein